MNTDVRQALAEGRRTKFKDFRLVYRHLVSSTHKSLRSKLKRKFETTFHSLLSLDGLEACIISKDCNSMGHEYYRFIGWFADSGDETYFEVFDWNSDQPPLTSWQDGVEILANNGRNFVASKIGKQNYTWFLEETS